MVEVIAPAYILPQTVLKKGWASVDEYELHRRRELEKVQTRGWGWDYIHTKIPPVLHSQEERADLLLQWKHRPVDPVRFG